MAQASAKENDDIFDENSTRKHYPDYNTIPHLPNLQELAAAGGGRNGIEEISLNDQSVKTIDGNKAVSEEIVLNASRLQVESETA